MVDQAIGAMVAQALTWAMPLIGDAIVDAGKHALTEAADGALGKAGEDAYEALRERLSRNGGAGEVALLEADPASKAKQAVVAEFVDKQTEQERDALRDLAQKLIDQLRDSGHAVGLDLRDLKDVKVAIGDVEAEGAATGVRIDGAEGGKVFVTSVSAKGRLGN